MNRLILAQLKKNKFVLIGAILCLIFWLIDSSVDSLFFDEDESIMESFISPRPVELWMRGMVVFLLMSFSFYTKYLFERQQKLTNTIEKYKNNLEDLVDERTSELHAKNKLLEDEIYIRKQAEEKLELIATTDSLTLLYNRRKFDEMLKYEIDRDRRYKDGLSLIMSDIDHFKQINDQYGHHVGDKILIEFVEKVTNAIRKTDVFARWGGEEFALLIPGANAEIAMSVAEKIRSLVESSQYSIEKTITASFGVAVLMDMEDEESLVKRADKALYRAKENGRNCVEFASEDVDSQMQT